MTDIEFKLNQNKFKYRVNGIVIHNNKVLALKMKNNVSYCLPGGHVELGESTQSAILREMAEELQTEVSIDKELAFVENFYLDKNNLATHELSFYYIVKPKNFEKIQFNNYCVIENDKGETKQHNFEWLDIDSLSGVDLKPEFIKSKLASRKL